MPVSSDKLKVLYDAVSADYDLGTIDDFKAKLSDPTKRKSFFEGVGAEYDLGKDINDFESKLGFKKKDGGVVSSPSMESPLPSPSVGIDPAEIQKRYDRVGKGRTYLNDLIDKKRTELPDFAPMATDFVRSAAQFNEAGKKAERTNLVYDFFDKNFDVNTNDNTRNAFISSQYAGTYFSESPDLKYEYDKSDMKSMLTPRQFSGLKSLSFGKQSEYGEAIKKLSDPNVGEAEKSVIKLELDKIGVGIDKDAAAAMVNQGVNSDIATQIFSKAKADEPLIEESLRNVDYENPYSIRTFKNVIKGATERGYLVGERADLVTATAEETGIDVDRLAYLQGELKSSKASKAYEQFSEDPSFENFKKAPIGIMLELSLESLAALYTHGASRMAAGAATGAAVGSVLPGAGTAAGASYGTISGMGLASLNLEYSSSILEGLDAIGVNTADPEALRSAFASEETMSKLKRTAYAKSIPVAIFDMLSAGIAGKVVTKPAKTVIGRVAGGVAEMGVQAAAGMAGEAAGQLAAEGRIYAPNAVLLEGLGELGPGVIEVAYGSMVESAKRNRQIAKADAVNVVASGQQETVRQNVDAEVKAGTMSQEQANVVKEEIAKTEVSVAKIPDDLSVDAKSQIVELIEKKSELSAKAKTLDDAFRQDVETQIADVDQQIIQITQNDRNATVQSQVEQQAGPAEGGVQERPGVDGGQQEVGQGAGQQGQAPVTQPDTGDRVLSSQEEVALAGELRGELRQDFQPIIDRAAQSLQAANVQFEVLDDAEFTARVGQSAEGAFMTVGNDGKILLNRQKMEQADPGVIIWHESAHPVMNTIRNTNKPLYDRMVTGLKQVAQRSPELQRALEFGKQYGAKLREAGRGDAEAIALEDDESIVESIAMIAADDKLMASLPTSVKQTLIDFVNYIAKALGIKGRVTNTASADFRRTAQQIATALKEGRDITEIVGADNVGEIDNRLSEGITDIDGNPADNSAAQFKVSGFKALINGIEFKYLKDSDRYNQLKADGFITEDKKISDFSNVPAILHVPDHAFTGEMVKDGETIVEGKGGVFYPLRFHDLGYFWASTKTAAMGMAAKLNTMRAQSPDGKMRLVLLSAPEDKLMSSTAASAGMLDVLLSKAFDRRAKITKDQVFEAYRLGVQKLKQEALTKGQKGVKFSGKVEDFVKTLPTVAKSTTVDVFKSKLRPWFAPDVSNFDQRKKLNSFVLDSIAEIVSDKDAAAQILEFLAESSGQKIKSTGGRLSKANLVSGFSKLFSEPMLKGVATTGDAYAVIELDADVEAVQSNEHESYPFALKSVDATKKPVVNILQDRRNWAEFTIDPETGDVVSDDRRDNVLPPSAGISNVVTLRPQAATQLSIGGRQPVGQINWERSLEGKGDPSISSRNPVVTKAAKDLQEGRITNEEYRAIASENSPIRPITRFFEPATEQQVKSSLSVDKSDKANAPLTDGTTVGLRLDIPAYQNKNTWVVSVHEGNTNAGKPISYRNVAMIRNVKFGSTPKGVLNIATGKEKQTIGRMFGEWVNIPGQTMEQQGESAKRMVQDIVDSPDYVQVGMNPFRHSYFYDRNTDIGRPIVSADEVIQVGGLVYAKNPVYGNWTDESYAVKGLFDAAGKQVQFSIGNRDSIVRSLSMVDPAIKQELKKMSEPSAVTADDLAMFFRMPDGTYSDGNDDYDSWDNLRQVGEDNDLRLRQSTPEEIRSKRYEDKYVLDNILEEKENEILQKQFDSKMEVWNFFNDEGLNRLGYNSPMEMSDVDRQIHAALVKKGVEEFERQELSTLADAYEIIGNSVDESIADAYLKAKADGASQEFVRQVDSAIESRQLSAGPRAESRVEFKLVAFVLRKKAEGYTDQQIAKAIRTALPGITTAQLDALISDPKEFLRRAYPGITPMQFENLLRRAEVKNIYRGNMPQNIAGRFLTAVVPNEVLEKYYMQVKTKAQVRKDAINQFLTKNFDPAKGLPKWVMQLKEFSTGAKNIEIARAKSTLDRLAKTAREIGFTDWELFSAALRNLNEEEAIMSGSTELAMFDPAPGMAMVPSAGERLQTPMTMLRLPLEIQPYVREMRNQIDALSKRLITGGFVTPEQAVKIEMNLGEYTNRAYKLYTQKGFTPTKEAFDAAVTFLADQEYRRLLTEYVNNLSVAVRGQIGVMTAAGPIVAESGTGIPYADLMEQAAQYAQRRANDIITKKETPYFGGSGPTSRGLGILKQRQSIPKEIRALMGEYTDPGVVFMMTVAKQAELAATSDYLRQLRDQGLGTLFFEKNDPNRPATHSVPLAGETSATMEPLNGLYTTKEIAEAFEDAVNTRNAVVQLWMKIVGANRWLKTVGSIRTQFVNFESNIGFAVLNGLIFTKDGRPWSKSMGEAWRYVKGQYGPKEISEITDKAIRLNLVGQNVDINAIRKAFREDDMFEMALDVALTSEGVFKKTNIKRIRPQAPFNKAYRMGDDFWKVYGYITEREVVAKGRHETSYDQLTDEQKDAVDKEAADRVKDTWPTYDRMFEAVRKLTQNVPILGNFPAFQGESIRVLINAAKMMKKDLADPQMRIAGVRRALGISTYLGLRASITTMTALSAGYGVSGLVGMLLNDDEEEDKKWAIKQVSPIFMRSGDLLIKQDNDKPHIYTVVDLLSIDPIGITQRSLNAFTEGSDNMDAGAKAAVAELLGGFLEREMTFKAVEDLTLNRNSANGLKIYNDGDTFGEAVGKITAHAWKSLKPSSYGLVERALTNENKAFEAYAFVGFRPYEIDLHQSFNISLTRMRNSVEEISAEYFKIKFDPKVSEEDKEQARLRAGEKKAEVIKKYNRLYTTLIKLGASQQVMEEMVEGKSAVKPTGMDGKTKLGIIEGEVDPTSLY
jgi:hypothetical protein